mmetsp:Transcript_2700/g.8182  ORF Transcript_2700/g.8182 Transcript_2700/m.8182 type:complete len:303 (+) Transcript_2700:607-1515(+)
MGRCMGAFQASMLCPSWSSSRCAGISASETACAPCGWRPGSGSSLSPAGREKHLTTIEKCAAETTSREQEKLQQTCDIQDHTHTHTHTHIYTHAHPASTTFTFFLTPLSRGETAAFTRSRRNRTGCTRSYTRTHVALACEQLRCLLHGEQQAEIPSLRARCSGPERGGDHRRPTTEALSGSVVISNAIGGFTVFPILTAASGSRPKEEHGDGALLEHSLSTAEPKTFSRCCEGREEECGQLRQDLALPCVTPNNAPTAQTDASRTQHHSAEDHNRSLPRQPRFCTDWIPPRPTCVRGSVSER